MLTKGIITGCDQHQEWLLPWWWENYTQENTSPVTFVDFGMTVEARQWCERRGSVVTVSFDAQKITSRDQVDPSLLKAWEHSYASGVWQARECWFQKPFAFLQSPYEKSIWLDLDCEVLGTLDAMYERVGTTFEVSIALEPEHGQGSPLPGEVSYNSGVVVFCKNSRLIKKWAEMCLLQNHHFMGDQNILSRLIFLEAYPVDRLPEIYNWRMASGFHLGAVIVHWVGWGKEIIKKHGGVRKAKQSLYS